MLLLRAEELGHLGIAFQAASQLVFQDTLFIKGPSFPTDERQAAITSCNKYLKADILCLIVENQGYFTLWPENKDLNLPEKETVMPSEGVTKYQNSLPSSQAKLKPESVRPSHLKNSDDRFETPATRFVAKNEKFRAASER